MGNVINKVTSEVLFSVNTPDYDSAEWLIDPPGIDTLLADKVPVYYWKIENDDVKEMVQQEKDVVVSNKLEVYRVQIIEATGLKVQAYIEAHYPDRKQRTLTFLYSEAQKTGDIATVALIQKAWDWVITIIQGYYVVKQKLITATTLEEIQALTFDTAPYDATDPKVSIEQVFALQGR